jgi:hypothetical protein
MVIDLIWWLALGTLSTLCIAGLVVFAVAHDTTCVCSECRGRR